MRQARWMFFAILGVACWATIVGYMAGFGFGSLGPLSWVDPVIVIFTLAVGFGCVLECVGTSEEVWNGYRQRRQENSNRTNQRTTADITGASLRATEDGTIVVSLNTDQGPLVIGPGISGGRYHFGGIVLGEGGSEPEPDPDPAIPDAITPVIGFRIWYASKGFPFLFPLHQTTSTPWSPTEMHAACYQGHKAPHEKCNCGLYAYSNPFGLIRELYSYYADYPDRGDGVMSVFGRVEGYGGVIPGEAGWRAEKAKVTAIFAPPAEFDTDPRILTYLTKIARNYAVPLLSEPKYLRLVGVETEATSDL